MDLRKSPREGLLGHEQLSQAFSVHSLRYELAPKREPYLPLGVPSE